MIGRIVLASASPRRAELLKKIGIDDFVVRPTDTDEVPPKGISPKEIAKTLSFKKAEAVAAFSKPLDIVIAADTIVICDGKILGKPTDDEDAFKILSMLSGRAHEVITGVCVRRGDVILTHAECTKVVFRRLSQSEIQSYIGSSEGVDKAGSYGVQGLGAILVSRIEGDFYNVVGLPLCALASMLETFGVRIL